jgi:hypothetical protein
MGPFEAQIITIIFGVSGTVAALGMILRFMLRRKELEARKTDPDVGPLVEALRDELDETRAQLADVQERLDFAERVLTAGRSAEGQKEGG